MGFNQALNINMGLTISKELNADKLLAVKMHEVITKVYIYLIFFSDFGLLI